MHSFIYKFATFAAIVSLVGAFLNGVSMPTSLLRAGLVFLGTLLLFIVALSLMRWTVIATTIIEQKQAEDEDEDAPVKTNLQTTDKPIEVNS